MLLLYGKHMYPSGQAHVTSLIILGFKMVMPVAMLVVMIVRQKYGICLLMALQFTLYHSKFQVTVN